MTFEELLLDLRKDVGPTLENSIHDITSKHAITQINRIYPLQNKCVLDVGCGLGRDMKTLESFGARVWGITINTDEYHKIKHNRKYLIDMHKMAFTNFDLIFASHVLEHSPCPLLVLKNFYECLTPDGACYIEVPSPQPWAIRNQNHYSIFCKDMWIELFDKAGFILEENMNFKVNVDLTNGKIEDEFWGFFLRKKNVS